jgi:hypothetical protein
LIKDCEEIHDQFDIEIMTPKPKKKIRISDKSNIRLFSNVKVLRYKINKQKWNQNKEPLPENTEFISEN